MNIKKLAKKAKKGNKDALLQLILAEKDAYYKLAYTYVKNEHDAKDVIADMIVKLYEHIEQLEKNDRFYSWSKTILVNCCKQLLLKRKRVVYLNEDTNDDLIGEEATNQIGQKEEKIDLERWLLSLNDEQREAIELKYFHDFTYEMIATTMDVPVGTVKSRISTGLRKLRMMERGEGNGANG